MEKIRVAIVMTAQRLCAMKVEDDGRLETISLDGNESMKYSGESDFLEFADYIKKFYNVSELDDLDFSVVLLKAGVDAEKARQIIEIFEIVSDLYVLDAKDFESVFGEGANIFKANDAELDELKAKVGKLKDEIEKERNVNKSLEVSVKKETKEMKQKIDELEKVVAKYKAERASHRIVCHVPEISLSDKLKYKPTITITIDKKDGDYVCDGTKFENKATAGHNNSKKITAYSTLRYAVARSINDNEQNAMKKKILEDVNAIATINVRKGNGSIDSISIPSIGNGKIFYLVKNGQEVEFGDDFAIIGDLSDTREDILEWYNSHK